MSNAKKFEKLVKEVQQVDYFDQQKLLYVMLGSLSAVLERPSIKKSDIVFALESSLKYFRNK